jgi:hypothetical protein
MTVLRRKMMHDLALAGLAKGTCSRYLSTITSFALFHGRSPHRC